MVAGPVIGFMPPRSVSSGLRSRVKPRKLEVDRRLHDAVAEGLREDFSPQQVSGRLVELFPDDPGMRVSHETIYQTLFLQARVSCVRS